jgi:hypothetical protein
MSSSTRSTSTTALESWPFRIGRGALSDAAITLDSPILVLVPSMVLQGFPSIFSINTWDSIPLDGGVTTNDAYKGQLQDKANSVPLTAPPLVYLRTTDLLHSHQQGVLLTPVIIRRQYNLPFNHLQRAAHVFDCGISCIQSRSGGRLLRQCVNQSFPQILILIISVGYRLNIPQVPLVTLMPSKQLEEYCGHRLT